MVSDDPSSSPPTSVRKDTVAADPAPDPGARPRIKKRRKRRRVSQGAPQHSSIFQNKVFMICLAIVLLFVALVVIIPRFEGSPGVQSTPIE